MAMHYIVSSVGAYTVIGLSTDIKPTAPLDGSLFIETDTSHMYSANAGTWVLKTTGAELSLIDSTLNNASTDKHGFLPKLDGLTTTFLRGDGAWGTPTASAATLNPNLNVQGADILMPVLSSIIISDEYDTNSFEFEIPSDSVLEIIA